MSHTPFAFHCLGRFELRKKRGSARLRQVEEAMSILG